MIGTMVSIGFLLGANLATPLTLSTSGVDLDGIFPSLNFGASCESLERVLKLEDIQFALKAGPEPTAITSGRALGHRLHEATPSDQKASKVWCSPDVGIYRIELNWYADESGSVYRSIIEALTRHFDLQPSVNARRRRGANQCAVWSAPKATRNNTTVKVCEMMGFTRLVSGNHRLEKAAKAARVSKKIQ